MLKNFLFEFGTLFAIINPFGLAFVFLDRSRGLTDVERAGIARLIGIYAFVLLIASLFLGTTILGFFGVSLPALRVAGGFVVAATGWALLNQAPHEAQSMASQGKTLANVRDEAFFPLTVPLTTGPGTIAATITLAAGHDAAQPYRDMAGSVLAALSVALLIYIAYARVSLVASFLGKEGTNVIVRLSAFLLMCVGVQIMMTGTADFFRTGSVTPGSG
jgi:multiple antibiotic resistance protein